MKTSILSKGILALAFAFICSLAVSAVAPKDYMYDTKEENGKVISKVIYLQEAGMLNKQVRYEFQYNNEGKVSQKVAYRWNGAKDEWVPFYQIQYQYAADGQISTHYAMWDAKKKSYTLNVQEMMIPAETYDEIFS